MLCIYSFCKLNVSLYYLFVLVLPLVFIIFLILKKKYLFTIITCIVLTFVSLYSFYYAKSFNKTTFNLTPVVLTATITHINNVNETFSYLTLSNCSILDGETEIKLDGNVSLSLLEYSNSAKYNIKDKVLFQTQLSSIDFFKPSGEVNTFYVNNNIKFVTESVNNYDVVFYSGNANFFDIIKQRNKDLLVDYFGSVQGNLAYSLLYGDKSSVDSQLLDSFKLSGVVHIFSVSGLHVALIAAIIYFLLKKLKANNYICFALTSLFLVLFCIFCSFSPSVFRATVMTVVFLLSKLFFKKNDALNSFSLAGIILLIINPMVFFNGGFQLSFLSVAGILFFSSVFSNIKINNKKFSNILKYCLVTISTQVALLPLLAKYYGFVATYSVFFNLITIPIFSVFYPVLFVCNLLVLIAPFLAFIYFFPKCMLLIIIYINSLAAFLPFGTIKLRAFSHLATILYFAFMFCVSKYIMLSLKLKIATALVVFILFSFAITTYNLPYYYNQNIILSYSTSYSFGTLIKSNSNNYYLVNPKITRYNLDNLKEELSSKNITKISALIIANSDFFEAKSLSEFLQEYNCKVYLQKDHQVKLNLTQIGAEVFEVENNFVQIDDFLKIKFCYYGNKLVGSVIVSNYFSLAFINTTKFSSQEDLISAITTNFDINFSCVKIYGNNYLEALRQNLTASNYLFELNQNVLLKFDY